jgi:hypothetical protein
MKYLLPLVLLFAACNGHLTGGEVIDKEYHPPYISHTEHCSKIGKVEHCYDSPTYHEATYYLQLKWCPWNQECHQAPQEVSPGEYANIQVGKWYGQEHPTWTPPPTFGEVISFIFFYMLLPGLCITGIVGVIWFIQRRK